MSETALSKSIRQALTKAGFWVVRLQSSGRRGSRSVASGEPGLPDICVLDAGPMFLEVKTDIGKLSDAQLRWHAKALQRGVRSAVVRSVSEAMSVVNGWRRCG